jgi:protein-S-isoprenylcysteine O-methyltransferase Ste14
VRGFLVRRGFILPVTVTGVVPIAITVATSAWRDASALSIVAGGALYVAGLSLLILTTQLFARHDGSLAPWNPPKHLVVIGLYRYCRNPMITGIYSMLAGEALALVSPWLAAWAALFMIGMTSHIVFQEERLLRERFGDAYDHYRRHVPRWLPRVTPYQRADVL